MNEKKENTPGATTPEDTTTNNTSSEGNKKLSAELRDTIANLAKITDEETDLFFEIFKEARGKTGKEDSSMLECLCNHYAALREVPEKEQYELLKFLEVELQAIWAERYSEFTPKLEKTKEEREAEKRENTKTAITLLETGEALDFVADTIGKVHFGDRDIIQLLWLSTVGVRQPDKIHWLLVGTPGSGKSDIARKVLRVIPDEHQLKVDGASPKSLYYTDKAGLNLSQRVIYIDDVTPDTSTIGILKAVATDDREALRYLSVDDKRQLLDLEIPRDIVVIATTIESLTDKQGQLLRRYQIVNPDETETALAGVEEMIKRAGMLPYTITNPEFDRDVEICKTVYNLIVQEDVQVAIPFDYNYGLTKHADKTTLKGFIALVRACALVNFPNRVRIGDVILATPEDLERAGELWGSTLALKVDKTAEKVLNCLPTTEPITDEEDLEGRNGQTELNEGKQTFCLATNIANYLHLGPSTVREKLLNLYASGLTDRKKSGMKGTPWVSWRVDNGKGTTIAKIKEETFEQDAKKIIELLTERYGGDPKTYFIAFENSRRERLGASEKADEPIEPVSSTQTRKKTASEDMSFKEQTEHEEATEQMFSPGCHMQNTTKNDEKDEGLFSPSRQTTPAAKTCDPLTEQTPENSPSITPQNKQIYGEDENLVEQILTFVSKACEDVEAFNVEALTNKLHLSYDYPKEDVKDILERLINEGKLEKTTDRYSQDCVRIPTSDTQKEDNNQ